MRILLHLSFVGTNYCGYQVQPNGVTVQQKLNEAAKALFGVDCDVVGCSRTDSGVHANHFCVAVSEKGKNELTTTIPIERIPMAISRFLPEDIGVFRAEVVPSAFHPRYDVAFKEYVYRIWNAPTRNPFLADRAWHYPKPITEDALLQMQEAAKHFVGEHDFAAYMAADSKVTDTVRTVYRAEVSRVGDIIEFRVSANGFLYNMVRILTGTLVAVAEGKISPEDIDGITASKDRKNAGITVPAHGLYLDRVEYGTASRETETI